MTRYTRDVAVAAAFAVLALVFLVEGRDLPFESRGIPGPGLFPFLLAVGILCFSVALTLVALGLRRRQPKAQAAPVAVGPSAAELTPTAVADNTGIAAGDEAEEPRSQLRALALWLLVLVVCVVLPIIGFLPAMLLLSAVLTLFMERRRDVKSLLTAVAVPIAFYLLFAMLLDVRLPAGFFG